MKIGTKSLLFGCHQAVWHPFTVALAYRKLFRQWPDATGWLCIVLHDVGYWGRADIDGKEGKLHPMLGAKLVGLTIKRLRRIFCRETELASSLCAADAALRCLLHSGSIARDNKQSPSDICWADKFSLFMEPEWFYLLRTKLSGELDEFVFHAVQTGHVPPGCTGREWLHWFKGYLCSRPEIFDLLQEKSPVRNHYLLRYSPRVLKGWRTQFEKMRRECPARTNTTQSAS